MREIAEPLTPDFISLFDVDGMWPGSTPAAEALLFRLRKTLEEDDIVKSDSVTGAYLTNTSYSENYLDRWLESTSSPVEPSGFPERIRFDNAILRGSVDGDWKPPNNWRAYSGGLRWSVTMRAILTIVAGHTVAGPTMQVRHYRKSGLLECYGDGNHRLLAYILTGEQDIPGLERYEEREHNTSEINEALKVVERICPDRTFVLEMGDFKKEERQTNTVVNFVQESTQEQQRNIHYYLKDCFERRTVAASKFWTRMEFEVIGNPNSSETPAEILAAMLCQHRAIQNRNTFTSSLKLWKWTPFVQEFSLFERWLLGYTDFR